MIADIARTSTDPTVEQMRSAAREHIGGRGTTPAQVRTQIALAVTSNYFRLYAPDETWRFRHLEYGTCTTDGGLLWIRADGRVMVDVVLSDQRPGPSTLHSLADLFRERTTLEYGPGAVLRLLVPRSPELSMDVPSAPGATLYPLGPNTRHGTSPRLKGAVGTVDPRHT